MWEKRVCDSRHLRWFLVGQWRASPILIWLLLCNNNGKGTIIIALPVIMLLLRVAQEVSLVVVVFVAAFIPIRSLGFIVFWFLGEQMLLVVLANNSGLFWAKNKHQVPYKKQKTIRSNKKNVIYDLMTDLGLLLYNCICGHRLLKRVGFGLDADKKKWFAASAGNCSAYHGSDSYHAAVTYIDFIAVKRHAAFAI